MDYSTLLAAVKNINGTTFVGIDTLTHVKLTGGKSNPQQGHITKRMSGAQVMCFQNKNINGYEQMIRRRLIDEGKDPDSFQLGERSWGVRLENLPIVEHQTKDGVKHYLEVIFLRPGKVEYFCNGQPIDKKDIVGLPDVTVSDEAQGGLDNVVHIRTYSVDSIVQLRINNQVYN